MYMSFIAFLSANLVICVRSSTLYKKCCNLNSKLVKLHRWIVIYELRKKWIIHFQTWIKIRVTVNIICKINSTIRYLADTCERLIFQASYFKVGFSKWYMQPPCQHFSSIEWNFDFPYTRVANICNEADQRREGCDSDVLSSFSVSRNNFFSIHSFFLEPPPSFRHIKLFLAPRTRKIHVRV